MMLMVQSFEQYWRGHMRGKLLYIVYILCIYLALGMLFRFI